MKTTARLNIVEIKEFELLRTKKRQSFEFGMAKKINNQ